MTPGRRLPPAIRQALAITAKVTVSAALMALLLSRTDLRGLADQVFRASPFWVTAALGIYLTHLAVNTWRWRLLLDTQGTAFAGRQLFASYLVATFFNNFLPSNIGGDVGVGSIGSGDFELDGARGDVKIGSIGSGDADLRNGSGAVRVDSIGSGDLDVRGAASLSVGSIGSGEASHHDVRGAINLPRKR